MAEQPACPPNVRSRHYRTALICFVAGWLAANLAQEVFSPAVAQVPDAGAQRLQLQLSLDQTSARLGEILDVLRRGTLQVRVVEADKGQGAARTAPGQTQAAPPTHNRAQQLPAPAGTTNPERR